MTKQKWTVTVEPADGSGFQYKSTRASDLDEATSNVRKRIPASWRIVAAEEAVEVRS